MNKKNNKKFKSKNNIIFIVMIVLSISIILGTGAYAYYQSTIAGNVSGTIAKWSLRANNQTESFDLDLGALYPGKTGTYNLELSAEDSDLDVYYELLFEPPYTNGEFYWYLVDYDYEQEFDYGCDGYHGRYGIIPAGEKITIPLYYNWDYDYPYDNENYADGRGASGNITIIGRQYNGYNGEIPIGILNNPDILDFVEIDDTSGFITVAIDC